MSRPLTRDDSLNIADIIPNTDVEGPGTRFAVWVQGCPFRCPGCCNVEMQSFEEKSWMSVQDLADQIEAQKDKIEGVTLLGGEPFSQASAYGKLAKRIQEMGLGVMAFTGFTLEKLRARKDPGTDHFLNHIDLLVDGPFLEGELSEERRYVGSANQGLHFLTDRYKRYDGAWPMSNGAIEIRFDGDTITINGHPRPTIF